LAKSVLLGSAAVLTVAAGAQAADLPSRKAAPVEYVKICDAYGAGFFYIPGTDTCLRIGGYVRAEYDFSPGQSIRSAATGAVTQIGSAQDQTGMEMRGRIDVDARTQTAWGTVQTVVQLRGANTEGLRTTSATSNFTTAYVPVGNSNSALTMERAYIRFAGLTAGVAEENANTMPSYMYSSNVYPGFPNGIKQLVYTATFGGGFSATFGVESRGEFGYNKPSTGSAVAPSLVTTATNSQYVSQWDTGYELVGNVRYDASWGYVQVAGLAGDDSVGCTSSAASPTGQVCTATYNPLVGPTKYGQWGFVGSFGVKLPMIAPGDEFHMEGTVTHGFIGASESTGGLSDLSDSSNKRAMGGVIRADSNLVPTVVSSTGAVDAYGETDAWGVYGIFTHYWTPQWRSNLAVGYLDISPPTANCSTVAAGVCVQNGGLNTQWGEGKLLQVAGNIIWSPTKNFNIGFEAEYLHLTSVLQNQTTAFIAAGSPGLTESAVIYHLRLERQF
ncbi:MAG TPA: porin, partial [Beijerinckiaceae bacterium]|nr:porin [Beijerinckiaceae bacterium]